MSSDQTEPLKIGQEYPPENESAIIEEIARLTSDLAARKRPNRAAHAKTHGCVSARFRVESNLGVGVFQPDAEYDARIRFSSCNVVIQPDHIKDIRAMAIKLYGVEGGEQDFLMISSNVFFSPNAADLLEFTRATVDGSEDKIKRYFAGIPLKQRETFGAMQINIRNPLDQRYYSSVPYKLGDASAVKYSATPASRPPEFPLDTSDDNFLATAVAAHLRQSEALFDFQIQVQTNADSMPIEDATVAWDEKDSPFIKVATITIPRQEPADCEDLSFDPWHALPEHTPLGSMGRIRKVVYRQASAVRHGASGTGA